jgi:hypothetical protein
MTGFEILANETMICVHRLPTEVASFAGGTAVN